MKKYTLSEISVFFKVIVQRDKERKLENISHTWMGNNISHENLQKMLFKGKKIKKQEPTAKEVANEWNRLKTFMSGVQ